MPDPLPRPSRLPRHPPLDPDHGYALAPGAVVIARTATSVQIGTEAPRRVLVEDAPNRARQVLTGLDGSVPLAEAVARAGGRLPDWLPLLGQLADVGLLVPTETGDRPAPRLRAERLLLSEQYGVSVADRLLSARSDAVVVVDGSGPLADSAAALLVAAGIGRVHQPSAADLAAPVADAAPAPRAARAAAVRPFPPAPQTHPSAVLLADIRGPDLGRAAELVAAVVPHLAAHAGPARTVVGPLVLPGRSACLNCVERHRADVDPGWPQVAAATRLRPSDPAPRAAQAAAILSVEQILDLIDGMRRPEAVGATIERRAGSIYPRRRPWPRHPECRCAWLALA